MTLPTLYIRPLMEESEAAAWATSEELCQAATFPLEQRRREFLTWRAVVREVLGREVRIAYNELGAPFLPDQEAYISVSHSGDRVAVTIAERPTAVDLERTDRRFQRILHKYLTPEEQALSDDPHFPAVAWCAKEAVYKWAGIRALGFEEVQICSFVEDRLMVKIRGGEPIELAVRKVDETYMAVYL